MGGLPSILYLFRKVFNKFNNTRARISDYIYHVTLRLLWNVISAVKRYTFVIMYTVMDVIKFPVNEFISLPDATSYDKYQSFKWTFICLSALIKCHKHMHHIKYFKSTPTFNMLGILSFSTFAFVALRPKSTAMVIEGRSVHLTTLFPGQAWTSG